MDLQGKTALVTGASGGIGKALAQALAKQGMKVAVSDRAADKLDDVVRELGASAASFPADVTADGAPGKLVADVVAQFGALDVVLNNAGAMVVGKFDEIDMGKVRAMIRVNVEGAFALGFAALRHFKQQGYGFLVNTSSVAGVKSSPMTGAYAGSKAAIEAFTEGMRLECAGTDIGVACIEPGTVDTGLFDEMSDGEKEAFKKGDLLQPADIAEAVIFILTRPKHVRVPRLLIVPSSQAF